MSPKSTLSDKHHDRFDFLEPKISNLWIFLAQVTKLDGKQFYLYSPNSVVVISEPSSSASTKARGALALKHSTTTATSSQVLSVMVGFLKRSLIIFDLKILPFVLGTLALSLSLSIRFCDVLILQLEINHIIRDTQFTTTIRCKCYGISIKISSKHSPSP